MSITLAIALGAALLSPPHLTALPADASGPINCPKPPKTITTSDGRIYECHPEEGMNPYHDVTPPDDKTHWQLPFDNPGPPPFGTETYHPPESWPFRAILFSGNPRAWDRIFFYVFDHQGVIVDSNEPDAIGNQMMEVRVSGVRMWPTARVYYRLIPNNEQDKNKRLKNTSRIGDVAYYALVMDGDMLCPALDESTFTSWPGNKQAARLYINGRCGEAPEADTSHWKYQVNSRYYGYPGFESSGLGLTWTFWRHDEPDRPLHDNQGNCLVFCDK
ncbi:hypothetical protein [Pseudoxanthomonas mexicana]|uniref:hypothetical protein n=1 Tax=Pseudoxanthomonas mexicana TaxID=128785 RepID=UPI00398B0CBC